MRSIIVMALACWSGAAFAADEPRPRIIVTGTGRVMTPPDLVTIDFGVRGEGATSDAAVSALVAKRGAIDTGLAEVASATATASRISVTQVRGSGCKRDDDEPRLSAGACAVVGYIAAIDMRLRTTEAKTSGTIVGLLGRLHADNPRLDGIMLSDPAAAEGRAMVAALIDARRQAEAIAAGTGAKLGKMIVATSGGDRRDSVADIIVTGQRRSTAQTIMPPPIAVDLTLGPIETQAQVTVTYEIAP